MSYPDRDVLAMKRQIAIPQHRSREQARFAEDLKAIADAEHWPATAGEVSD